MFSIRPFQQTDCDYHAAVSIFNRVWTEYPDTADEWKERDGRRAKNEKFARFLAEADGEAVAFATYSQPINIYHPNRFWLDIDVLPDFQRRGIGSALYRHLLAQLTAHKPATLFANTREDFASGVQFLTKLGYQEALREWESRLDPARVNLEPWRRYGQRMAQSGIAIQTVRELENDPDRDRKLYEMEWAIEQDVPETTTPTKPPFEEWRKVWTRSNLIPDAWWVAVQNGLYVGQTNLWRSQARESVLYTGVTGVVRTHRRLGIASALKVQAITYAQEHQVAEVRTWNEAHNAGMLSINDRFGFVRQPAHVDFIKKLREEPKYPAEEAKV